MEYGADFGVEGHADLLLMGLLAFYDFMIDDTDRCRGRQVLYDTALLST